MKIRKTIEEIFFPEGIKCVICEGELNAKNRYGVCNKCMPPLNENYCQKCGRAKKDNLDYCADCLEFRYAFDLARAPHKFTGDVKSAVYRLKYGNGRYLAKYFAQFMADVFYQNKWEADLITFAPIGKKRLRNRGYNQAELIAKEIAAITKIPYAETLFKHVEAKKNLAKLNRLQRIAAIKGTISCYEDIILEGKRILFIDDVFTSGATGNECAAVLKDRGAASVNILTFATSHAHEIPPNRIF